MNGLGRDIAVIVVVWLGATVAHAPIMRSPFADEVEAREACSVAEVARKGRWLAPLPNDEFIPTKPPLLYWWAGGWTTLTGVSEAAIRWSVAGLGLVTLLATYAIGRRLGDRRTGVWAAVILATLPFFWVYFARLRVDTALVAAGTVSLAGFFYAIGGAKRGAFIGWTALGLACLAKGPVAPAMVGIPIALYLCATKDKAGALRCVSWFGIAACLAISVGWYAAARHAYGPEFSAQMVRESVSIEFGQTLAQDKFHHPAYWFADKLLAQLGLASALVLPALALPWRAKRPELWFPWMWFVGLFVLFSLIPYKREAYLLPLHPAAALLAALAIREATLKPVAVLTALLGVALAVGAVFVFLKMRVPVRWTVTPVMAWGLAAGAVVLLSGAALTWQGRAAAAAIAIVACTAAGLYVYGVNFEGADRRVERRPDEFARAVERRLGNGELRFAPGVRDFALIFYMNRTIPVTHRGELSRVNRRTFFIALPSDLPRLESELGPAVILEAGRGSTGPLYLVGFFRTGP